MSSRVLHLDVESRSTVDLKKTGGYVYFEHPTTDLWCVCFALDDEPVRTWLPGQPCPDDVSAHILSGGEVYGHNSAFERLAFYYILGPRYGWPEPTVDQWRCTMVMAYAMALPGALEDAAPAAGIDQRKDAAGHRLMLQMARPRKVTPDGPIWWDDESKLERLIAYCRTDVEVERELAKRLRPLKPSELDLWHLDQRINDRGVYVDVPLCNAAKKIVATTADRLDAEMRAVTGGAVGACSNVGQLIAWVRTFGVETESIAKDVLEELLATDLPTPVRQALTLRREAAKASVAKIEALLRGMSADGRARGLLQFHAAGTGRWAGRRFQPQNLPRSKVKNQALAVGLLMSGDPDLIEDLYGQPLSVVSDCLRGMVAAPPGKKVIACDYNAIEARVLAWLAGQDDLVRLFATGGKVYETMGAKVYGVPVSEIGKEDPRRQLGKTLVLGAGFGMGWQKFQATCIKMIGLRLDDETAQRSIEVYREANGRIKAFWYDLEKAAIEAVENPGMTTAVRDIRFKVAGSFLFMRLPSGRFLAYAYPEIQPKTMPWKDDRGEPVVKDSLSYMGVNSYTRKWERSFTYGGSLAENATQAVARDILADAMPRLEAAGYPIILTVHDEIVCEAASDFGSVEEMVSIMTTLPAWADGCPITAEGWEGVRYRK